MSIWNIDNKRKIKIKELDENIKVDTLIIGAGMTGLTTAYYLKNESSICVVDSGLIGHGVTLNSTAKINYLQERIYTKIKKNINEKTAIKYLNSQRYAIENIKKIIKDENINCDLKKVKSYVFANTKKEKKLLIKEYRFLRENKINIKEDKLPSKIKSYKTYSVEDTYTFNPIKYLYGLLNILNRNNIPIYENSKIINIKQENNLYICYSKKYKITANKVILACHYPFFIVPFLLPIKSYIEKSYIIISKVKKNGNYTCISSSMPTYSCRFYEDNNIIYQISLSESHNTAFKQNDAYHFKRLKEIFNLDEKDIVMSYSNTDIMTIDNIPYIGKIKNNLYIGVGYNTWGMTNSILAAKIISDSVLNKKNEFKNVFRPNRLNMANIMNLPIILFSNTKSYLGTKINKNKYWYSRKVKFIKRNNKDIAIYTDKNNQEHIVYNKCPHMGCSLLFNEKELTWDCPCHSSRFDIDGKCIKGPSKYDISFKNDL